jgi:hypothetical protein
MGGNRCSLSSALRHRFRIRRWYYGGQVYVLICIIVAPALLLVGGLLVELRRRRLISKTIVEAGGRVVAFRMTAFPVDRTIVEYISSQGELRQASMIRGQTQLQNDRTFECALRDQYQNTKSDLMAAVQLASQFSRLPGLDAWNLLARELASGTLKSATIEESAGDGQARWRFAPTLQCLEAMSIGSKAPSSKVLELTVDGRQLDVQWSVEGAAPHRSLTVTTVAFPASLSTVSSAPSSELI